MAPYLSAPGWRREPYRLLFPLGIGLAAVAVMPFATRGAGGGSLALFHSVAQIQGFLTCFAVGFLYTFLPRRTRTQAPAAWQMVAALGLPVAAVASAWEGDPVRAHWLWLALMAVVLGFTLRRLRGSHAFLRLPASFLWVPLSLLAGAVGAVLAAEGHRFALGHGTQAWAIGRGLLVQGLFAGLILGVGGFLFPQLTRGEVPPDTLDPARQRRALALHAVAALAFFASFPLEVLLDRRLGVGLRALVAGGILLFVARIHRPPTLPGLHRSLVWAAAWLVPLGLCMGALVPRLGGAALHVLFVGGFAQLVLAVATHVVLSHGSRSEQLAESPWTARVMAALLAAAFGARILAGIDLRRVATWLAVAAVAFLGAIAAWAARAAPALRASDGDGSHQSPARPDAG